MCPDYQGVLIFQVILYDEVSFGTSTKCIDYAGVTSVHINRFHGSKNIQKHTDTTNIYNHCSIPYIAGEISSKKFKVH